MKELTDKRSALVDKITDLWSRIGIKQGVSIDEAEDANSGLHVSQSEVYRKALYEAGGPN